MLAQPTQPAAHGLHTLDELNWPDGHNVEQPAPEVSVEPPVTGEIRAEPEAHARHALGDEPVQLEHCDAHMPLGADRPVPVQKAPTGHASGVVMPAYGHT